MLTVRCLVKIEKIDLYGRSFHQHDQPLSLIKHISSSFNNNSLSLQINVGCTSGSDARHPVRLEYSEDSGKTWSLVVPPCSQDSLPSCADQTLEASVYYSGTTPYWRRVIIPLTTLRICGSVNQGLHTIIVLRRVPSQGRIQDFGKGGGGGVRVTVKY